MSFRWTKCLMVFAGLWKRITIKQAESIFSTTMFGEQQVQKLSMKPSDKYLYGYSRDHKGKIINYHKVLVSNTVHTSTGSGGNTDQFVGMLYETYWQSYSDRLFVLYGKQFTGWSCLWCKRSVTNDRLQRWRSQTAQSHCYLWNRLIR